MVLASCPLQGAPGPLPSALGLAIPARHARCPGLTLLGFGSAKVRNRPGRAIRARRAARRSPGGAGAGPSGRGEARAEHVTTARGAGRAVPRGGSGGESNGGRGRLRAGRAAAGAAAAEARRAGTSPGRASPVIPPSTVAPGESAVPKSCDFQAVSVLHPGS
ncbi:spidroin-2-like [Peromyscus californicus insignis]|uniref:spidroin-2-like n=1 Tax=Peromyscus californicus insignis TaxID=564181 RepID=UPI0022A6F197|nr:spidroin-2-like [Peromyscus californicus insignis]